MSVTTAQLDAHLKSLKGKANLWPDIPGAQCMVIFASVNRLLGGPAYSAPGAKDLWNNPSLSSAYQQLPPSTIPRFGDIGIYGSSWGGGWGHITVAVSNIDTSRYNAFGQNPGPAVTQPLSKAGLLGWLRPKALAAPTAPKPAAPKPSALVNRRVTNPVAWVRTAPRSNAPLAPGYPNGLTKGTNIAVKGFVVGQDPYGTGDNAWYLTKSGFYVWANAAENTLAGLVRL